MAQIDPVMIMLSVLLIGCAVCALIYNILILNMFKKKARPVEASSASGNPL